jgi:transposase InsO family protein
VFHTLRQQGIACGRHRVARLMRLDGLRAHRKRPFRPRTTQAGPSAAPNLLPQNSKPTSPNRVWVSDITYIWTAEGWLYLAATMDLQSRRIVGWQAADHLRASLTEEALRQALSNRRPPPGLIHHSDRGSHYSTEGYLALLRSSKAVSSMSRKGVCYDNASMEAFWSSLKNELVYLQPPTSRREAMVALFQYIEIYYNRQRLHSSLGYRSPSQFEAAFTGPNTARAIGL